MSLIAEVRLCDDVILFEEAFDSAPDAEATFEDFHYVAAEGSQRYVFFWWVTAEDFDAFDDALEADDTVSAFRLINTVGGRGLYRVVTTAFTSDQPLVFPAFREYDITDIDTKRDADGLHLRARVPTREALNDFLVDAREMADTVQVTRLFTEEVSTTEETALTPRQQDVLVTAYQRGYFETPRRTSLEELATEFDVTPQTLSRHIRVGVEKLVGSMLATHTAPAPDH